MHLLRWTAVITAVMTMTAAQAAPIAWDAGISDDRLLLHVDTPVDEMPPQLAEAYVRGIQEELTAHGYRPGPVDARPGRQTAAAIRAYQRDAGLIVTGVPTGELLDHLKFALPKVNARPQGAGPSAALVTNVQRALFQRGYYTATIDGLLGPATRQAVRDFQATAGLPVTGKLDDRLLAEIKLAD
jgi:peptidoglycan hydrolase-like protein with peptidoglycan-binding domain